VAAALCVVGVVGAMLVGGRLDGVLSSAQETSASSPRQPVSLEPLPIVRPSDIALDRARSLRDDGRLRDALRSLDAIRTTDPLRAAAEALKAEIQEEILVSAGTTKAPTESQGDRP
jgi:hypothetical protein